jgi:hypothetical protein
MFDEFFILIILIEVGKHNPLLFWDYWKCRKSINKVNSIYQLVCKSSKCNDLLHLLQKYYFEDQQIIDKTMNTYMHNNDVKRLVLINATKNLCGVYSHNECLVTALIGHLHLCLQCKSLHDPYSYVPSFRLPIFMKPIIYDNYDEIALSESCILWMSMNSMIIKTKLIDEFKTVASRIRSYDE